MSGTGLQSLQKVVFATLDSDTALAALITGVYDQPPQTALFPYVAFGSGESRDASTQTTQDAAITLELAIYSREGGRKQALDIAERLHALLHEQALTLTGGYSLVWLRVESCRATLLGDGITWQGALRLGALVSEGTRQDAHSVVLKLGDGGDPESFTLIGGMTLSRLLVRRAPVPVSVLSGDGWRRLLEAAGECFISISGQGEYTDSAAEEFLRAHAFAGTIANYRMDFASGGVITVPCLVSDYERRAGQGGTLAWSITLESAGQGVYI